MLSPISAATACILRCYRDRPIADQVVKSLGKPKRHRTRQAVILAAAISKPHEMPSVDVDARKKEQGSEKCSTK